MRTQRELYSENKVVYVCELEGCLICGQVMRTAYTSGWKTVQTLREVSTIAPLLKCCTNLGCSERTSQRF
jgi:hypothetical protein